MPNIGAPPIPNLDLVDYVGQRSATFLFELSDGVTGQRKGTITPLRDSPPTLTHDTTATIKRNVSLSLGVYDSARINPIADRVEIFMLLGGVTYPLGRYLFVDHTDQVWTSGNLANVSLMDEMFIIDQPMTRGFAGNPHIVDAITTLLTDQFTHVDFTIEPSGQFSSGSWTGGTSRAQVLADLCVQGSYFSPWFDNTGVLRIIRSFDPADRPVDIDLDDGNQVIRATIADTTDLLKAPNRFVVISNGSSTGDATPAVGTYDVPPSAPHSIANRGFIVSKVVDMQVNDIAQAQAAARTIGLANTVFERVSLSTAADPRHDSYNVIRWRGEKWLEIGWSLTLTPGGPMGHTLRKVYV